MVTDNLLHLCIMVLLLLPSSLLCPPPQVHLQGCTEGGYPGAWSKAHPETEVTPEGNVWLQIWRLRVGPQGIELPTELATFLLCLSVFHPNDSSLFPLTYTHTHPPTYMYTHTSQITPIPPTIYTHTHTHTQHREAQWIQTEEDSTSNTIFTFSTNYFLFRNIQTVHNIVILCAVSLNPT